MNLRLMFKDWCAADKKNSPDKWRYPGSLKLTRELAFLVQEKLGECFEDADVGTRNSDFFINTAEFKTRNGYSVKKFTPERVTSIKKEIIRG
jgi:hypothetical protein